MSNADLFRADLFRASLGGGASMSGANMSGADLRGAFPGGAKGVTKEQLEEQTDLLHDAIMPDGSKHP